MVDINKKTWKPEDEKKHDSSIMEWWAIEGFFKTKENKKNWSIKTVFIEWFESEKDNGSSFILTLFDQDENKFYNYDIKKAGEKLEIKENKHYIKFYGNRLKGSYPRYEMFLKDKKNKIEIKIILEAESKPRWIAQDISDGWLPIGLGFYRYGFIPKCKISGKMRKSEQEYTIQGQGYYEHIWGDLWFDNPLSSISGLGKTLSIYSKLAGWWLKNNNPKIPSALTITSENSPFGYDWAWALFDNGWSIFYGNIMLWLSEGPVFGTLILTKDGENYKEFCNATFKYNKKEYSKNYDFYYPTDLELTAEDNEEKIHLRFKMTNIVREYVSKFPYSKFWKALVICESPGIVKGYHYYKDNKKTTLSGICKIEPQRQISILGHNSLKIKILKPPKGVGINLKLMSHFFRKKINLKLNLLPKIKCKINFKKIKNDKIIDNRKIK